MIAQKQISSSIIEGKKELKNNSVHEVFSSLRNEYSNPFLFESKDISQVYGRLSLIGIDPIIKISGKDELFKIEVLQERGRKYIELMNEVDFSFCEEINKSKNFIEGKVIKDKSDFEERKRSKRKNIAQIIRIFLEKNKIEERSFLGLYGAISYDFIRLFEDIPSSLPNNDIDDFTFYLYDTFVFFDHLKERTEIVVYRDSNKGIGTQIEELEGKIDSYKSKKIQYKISDSDFVLSKDEYEKCVKVARDYALKGELFEVVFSNILNAKFKGDPYALYLKYREVNPSPYLFYFDFGKEYLVGASPEMMVRVENNIAQLRPISGTIKRGEDPIEDHENMLELLSHPKERAELDMLIDLGRNDLGRVCESGVKISDYRFVEKYSRVMHTVAHLSGKLKDDYTAFDALISCINAGTLTGAPKVAAMLKIEEHEEERRGYYGGSIGYFTFSGEMDTGIIIRTAHIKNNKLRFQVGATLLYDSVPENEYYEIIAKAQAFLDTFQ